MRRITVTVKLKDFLQEREYTSKTYPMVIYTGGIRCLSLRTVHNAVYIPIDTIEWYHVQCELNEPEQEPSHDKR